MNNAVENRIKRRKKLEHWKVIALYLFLYDIIVVNFSYFFGLWLRFDFRFQTIPKEYLQGFLRFAPYYTVFAIVVFYYLRLYKSIWRFASFSELNRILAASLITMLFHTVGITLLVRRMPMAYYVIGPIVQFGLTVAIRFAYRFVLLERGRRQKNGKPAKNVMIIGAGAAGQSILRELLNSQRAHVRPCCMIDDNSNKWGRFVEGVPITGGRGDILSSVKKYKIDQIFLTIPTATVEQRRDILNICKETGCEMKSLPGMYQLVNGEVSLSKMRAVAVEDLLGRDPVKVNLGEIFQHIKDKVILVTGGGGSIGSELCRQIAGHAPGMLIIFDIYENNAYEIEQELKSRYPYLNMKVLIGSVRDSRRINWVFEQYHPDIVYHAAAHKHVPLMEGSPCEAIKNNVMGTYKTAYAALKNGCQRFVLISTDKAVNPTNIMGASKRLCEMIIQSMDRVSQEGREDLLPSIHAHGKPEGLGEKIAVEETDSTVNGRPEGRSHRVRTEFVAVRFGNVLGSNGSVIPLFRKQIEQGGPVTVTHPDIIRYFMTIPEAVSLVLQAGTYAKGGEIFILDMGDPVKIDTLARNLIRLSGHKPDEDIEVVYTGLRPGEKLYEEKLMAEEGMEKTPNDLIHVGKPITLDIERFFGQLEELTRYGYEEYAQIRALVAEMVPTYHSAEEDMERRLEKYRSMQAQAAAVHEMAVTKVE
ncbi:MAG: polysaccharide biosynthesis protein [Lachnospiraceae bacterium]|nr:polysaccharide biosynthesis protein [Lachnospiraceae bacterium]